MTDKITFPRKVLQRVSDRKKRKLALDDSYKILPDKYDIDLCAPIDSQIEVIEDSQSSMKGHRDLFGVLIPDDKWGSSSTPKTKSNKKTETKSKKKQVKDTISGNSTNKPQRIFIPTPKIVEIMKEAQLELYSLMGLNKSSSDVSVLSTGSLDVSGVQQLDKSSSSLNQSKNENKSNEVLKGVVAFVDYKIENDQSALDIIDLLIILGAKVENTFNSKVTHVVFHDGYLNTYKAAKERNIPLVTSKWVENSHLSDKMMDPADYTPVDIDKYTMPLDKNLFPSKFLRQSDINYDNDIRAKCDSLLKSINNLKLDVINKNPIICENHEVQETIKNPDNIIKGFSNHLYNLLNTQDSPYLDEEELSELYVPMSIKILRKYLTPKGIENKTPSELDNDLVEIENRLKLNSQARQRFRRLIFNSNNNLSIVSDFPSPSPQKLRISAPARLANTKKRKSLPGKEPSHQDKNFKKIEKIPEKSIIKSTQTNVLKWNIPTDLRPKKVKKHIAVKVTETRDHAISLLSRDSSMIFQTPEPSINSPVVKESIACTGLTRNEVKTIKLSIQNLGIFTLHTNVETSTTYLITKSTPNRTLNMIFAMAFGCNIVSENWVHESHQIGRWLPYERYLISDLSNPVKEFQRRRNTFGSLLTFHIFDEAGSIYVSNTCEPSAKHLKRLVRACGGKCTGIQTKANILVGKTPQMNNNVNERWILDCITQGVLLNKDQYLYDS